MQSPMNAAVQSIENPLRVDFCGLALNSPIVLLSGCVGFGEEYTRVDGFSNRDVGAIVLKGTTGQPRLGNRPHRVYETPSGMLNAIGLQNVGIDAFLQSTWPQLRGLSVPDDGFSRRIFERIERERVQMEPGYDPLADDR